eukprot:s60_g32.t1
MAALALAPDWRTSGRAWQLAGSRPRASVQDRGDVPAMARCAAAGRGRTNFGDATGDASAKFSDATYPIAEKINWGTTLITSNHFATVSARTAAQTRGQQS